VAFKIPAQSFEDCLLGRFDPTASHKLIELLVQVVRAFNGNALHVETLA
jgi:hypothetical protein